MNPEPLHVAIAGAGVMGRVLALRLARDKHRVTLVDEGDCHSSSSCSWIASGMLSPGSELDHAPEAIAKLGMIGLNLWPDILRGFDDQVFFQSTGTLIVAHRQDQAELDYLSRKLSHHRDSIPFQSMKKAELSSLEPELSEQFVGGIYLPQEGQIDARSFLRASTNALEKIAKQKFNTHITKITPGCMHLKTLTDSGVSVHPDDLLHCDIAIDCRGLGAKADWHAPNTLRSIRGELIHIHAPGVNISRPVRLMHPRYPIYIVPRPNHSYIIGSTMIESGKNEPSFDTNRAEHSDVSVQSAMELLSAAYSTHSGFSEARILELATGYRPAFPDHLPLITQEDGLIRINGLYRHGFMIAPALAEIIAHRLSPAKEDQLNTKYSGPISASEVVQNL